MPALAVTRAETRWTVTFANPPANLVDPEMILELQGLVDKLEHDPDVTVVVFGSAKVDHFLGPYDMSRAARHVLRLGRAAGGVSQTTEGCDEQRL